MYDMTVDEALRTLSDREASLRCRELVQLLVELGFNVRDGRLGGHKIVHHAGLHPHGWRGIGFNCGHNPHDNVRAVYVRRVRAVIEEYRDYLGGVREK